MAGFFLGALAAIALPLAGAASAEDGGLWIERERTPVRSHEDAGPGPAPTQPSFQRGSVRSGSGIERGTLPPLGAAPAAPGYGGMNGAGGMSGQLPDAGPAGMGGYDAPPPAAMTPIGGGSVTADVWRGLDFDKLRTRLLKVDGNGGSPVLNNLLAQALAGDARIDGAPHEEMLGLLKMVVLYRLGRIDELLRFIEQGGAGPASLTGQLFHARALLARADSARACEAIAKFPISDPNVPQELLAEALLTTALCAVQKKDLHTAGMMMELGRDKGIRAPIAFSVIEYLLSGSKPQLDLPDRLGVTDYLFLRLTAAPAPARLIEMADAALVFELAHDPATPPAVRAEALERAARSGAIAGEDLAALYRDVASRATAGGSDGETRARLFDGAARTADMQTRAKIVDTLLVNARKVRLAKALGPLLAPLVREMRPGSDLAWFAPRAVEVALLANDAQLLESWLLFVRDAGRDAYAAAEWLPLAGFVQPGLVPVEEASEMALRMAKGRRLDGDRLHLLASALDALAINVPIPLWNEAGNHPQPNRGLLPPAGTLSQLKTAQDDKRAGEALLLAVEALGASAPDELHMLALGDIIRALARAGFPREAGQFAFEALYRLWPTGQARVAAR